MQSLNFSVQYVQVIVPAVEHVIFPYLRRNVNVLIGAILVSSVPLRLGRLHQPFHLHQLLAQVPQRHRQYHLVLLRIHRQELVRVAIWRGNF